MLLGGDVDGVWWLKAKAINVCKFSSFSFKSIRLSRAHFFFTLQHFLWAFTHAKKSPSLHVKFKTFSLSCHATQKILELQFELKKFCSSNHVGGWIHFTWNCSGFRKICEKSCWKTLNLAHLIHELKIVQLTTLKQLSRYSFVQRIARCQQKWFSACDCGFFSFPFFLRTLHEHCTLIIVKGWNKKSTGALPSNFNNAIHARYNPILLLSHSHSGRKVYCANEIIVKVKLFLHLDCIFPSAFYRLCSVERCIGIKNKKKYWKKATRRQFIAC